MIDPELLKLLACPACKTELAHRQGPPESLGCARCGRAYPVRDGIPVLLIEEAS